MQALKVLRTRRLQQARIEIFSFSGALNIDQSQVHRPLLAVLDPSLIHLSHSSSTLSCVALASFSAASQASLMESEALSVLEIISRKLHSSERYKRKDLILDSYPKIISTLKLSEAHVAHYWDASIGLPSTSPRNRPPKMHCPQGPVSQQA